MTEDGLARLEAMALDGGQNLTPAVPALIAALRADRAELARLRLMIEDTAAVLMLAGNWWVLAAQHAPEGEGCRAILQSPRKLE